METSKMHDCGKTYEITKEKAAQWPISIQKENQYLNQMLRHFLCVSDSRELYAFDDSTNTDRQ